MKFNPLDVVGLILTISLAATHAATSTPALYWKAVLPNTPMPKAVSDLLQPDLLEDNSTTVGIPARKPGARTNVGVSKAPHAEIPAKRLFVVYTDAATQEQLNDDTNAEIFFLEKDMHPGKAINLDFTESTPQIRATFLLRQVADSIPFSSEKLPEIFNEFEVNPKSYEGETMKNTMEECETPAIQGEDKLCATSLESMVDFSTSKLGRNVLAISTEVAKKKQARRQEYRINGVIVKMRGSRTVVCHDEKYASAVFYCHAAQTLKAYLVPLEGADGTKVNAVAVCHTDTTQWNPKHLAFQLLKVKPGTDPICHFLPQDHIVWVPNN